MLTNLLPGLRDLRTPLAVGYLWLVALWLLLHNWIPKSVNEAQAGPIRALYQLGFLLGSPVVLAALSFVAYLLGAMPRLKLYTDLRKVARLGSGTIRRHLPEFLQSRWFFRIRLTIYFQLRTFVSTRLREAPDLAPAEHAAVLMEDSIEDELEQQPDNRRETFLQNAYIDAITLDLEAIGAQLQAKSRDFWDTYDRQLAEAEFRYGISPPLTIIICLIAIQSADWWWLVLLLLPVTLVVLGARHSFDAAVTLVQAVVIKLVIPPVMARFDEAVARKLGNRGGPSAIS